MALAIRRVVASRTKAVEATGRSGEAWSRFDLNGRPVGRWPVAYVRALGIRWSLLIFFDINFPGTDELIGCASDDRLVACYT